MIAYFCLLAVAIIASSLFLIWRGPEKPAFNALLKGIASFSFLALGIVCAFENPELSMPIMFILLGLSASVFGDMFLAGKDFKNEYENKALYAGFGSFAVAQVMYMLGFSFLLGFYWWAPVAGVLLALAIVFGEKLLKLDYGKFKAIVAVYAFVLMTALAQAVSGLIIAGFSVGRLLLMLGMIFFAVSDIILSFIYFRKDSPDILNYYNLGTYYVGQMLLASALFFI